MKIGIICPHCGEYTSYYVEQDRGIVTCDTEYGGCDKDIAYEISRKISVKTAKINFEKGLTN